jgi:hypothetical protein
MQVTGIFSTPILETTLDNVGSNVLEYVRNLPFESTNDGCCEYSVSKKIHNDPFFMDLFDDIKKVADIYAREVLGLDLTDPNFVMDLKTAWAIKMKPGDFAGSHYHAQSIFTGLLYLSVDKNGSSKLNLHRPEQPPPTIELLINNWNLFNCKAYDVIPETNKLIFFPSNINHSADINESNETLYCLVFDFFPRGVLRKNTTSELILNW